VIPPAGHCEIDHTADLGFEVWAADPSSLFAEAVSAVAELCYETAGVQPAEARRVNVTGGSLEELLVHWLQEVYLLLESDAWLANGAREVTVEPGRVTGLVLGEPYDAERHTLHTEIKAVTYHGLEVARREDGVWAATVIVDV
jgi:SHS2 domain-containing protein